MAETDSGAASSLRNDQQVGGSIGLAVLGTVAWTAVANTFRSQVGRGMLRRPSRNALAGYGS